MEHLKGYSNTITKEPPTKSKNYKLLYPKTNILQNPVH